jgi:hypothetical protein
MSENHPVIYPFWTADHKIINTFLPSPLLLFLTPLSFKITKPHHTYFYSSLPSLSPPLSYLFLFLHFTHTLYFFYSFSTPSDSKKTIESFKIKEGQRVNELCDEFYSKFISTTDTNGWPGTPENQLLSNFLSAYKFKPEDIRDFRLSVSLNYTSKYCI